MATVGLKMVTFGLLDSKTKKLIKGENGLSESGILEIGDEFLGTKTANITGLEGSIVKIAGNNKVQQSYSNPAATQIALAINNFNEIIKAKLLGEVSDGKGGYVVSGEKPIVVLLLESPTIDYSNSVYFGFGDGMVQETTRNNESNTDTTQNRAIDNLTYAANGCDRFKNKENDVAPTYKKFITYDSKFDKNAMMELVFPGYTAGGATPQPHAVGGTEEAHQ